MTRFICYCERRGYSCIGMFTTREAANRWVKKGDVIVKINDAQNHINRDGTQVVFFSPRDISFHQLWAKIERAREIALSS